MIGGSIAAERTQNVSRPGMSSHRVETENEGRETGEASPRREAQRMPWDVEGQVLGGANLVTEQEVAMLYSESLPDSHQGIGKWYQKGGKRKLARIGDVKFWKNQAQRRLPCLVWLPKYSIKLHLGKDLVSGLTVGVVTVPQALSYAVLAGLPPQYGLYCCLAAPLVYAMMGTCIQLNIGPFALISLVMINTISKVVDPVSDQERYVEACLTVSILCGCLMTIMGFLRLGFLVQFLSAPVISGLTTGGALLIATSQLGNLLGFSIPRGSFFATWVNALGRLGETNVCSLVMGIASFAILFAFRRSKDKEWAKKWRLSAQPVALYVMLLGLALSWGLDLHGRYGLKIMGPLPEGIPPPHVPTAFDLTGELIQSVIVVSIVGYALSMATAKTFAAKCNYAVSSNQELFALGLANLVGGFLTGYPAFSSLSRTSLVYETGAKTPMHNVFTVGLMLLVTTLLTGMLSDLPYASLVAIIVDSLYSLFLQLLEPWSLWHIDKKDMFVWLVTFFVTLIWDVDKGLLFGVLSSFLVLLYQISNPSFAVIGRFPKMPFVFKDLRRFREAQPVPRVLVLRFDSSLHFVNSENFRKVTEKAVAQRIAECSAEGSGRLHSVVLDASAIATCDSTAVSTLRSMQRELASQNIELILCNVRGGFRDVIKRSAVSFQEYVSLQNGVTYAEGKHVLRRPSRSEAVSLGYVPTDLGIRKEPSSSSTIDESGEITGIQITDHVSHESIGMAHAETGEENIHGS